jgi:hypothetical protein
MRATSIAVGLAIAAVLLLLALGFAALQWRERRQRATDLTADDSAYFARKDARRLAGSLVMGLIAVGMAVGLAGLDPTAGRDQRRAWAAVWLGVMVLVMFLLTLALWDWVALKRYAARHRRALDVERRAVVDEARRLMKPTDSDGPTPSP